MILIAMLPKEFKIGLVYILFMPTGEIEEVQNVEEQFLNNIYNPEFIVEDSGDTDGSGAVNDEHDAELINKANADTSGVVNNDVEIKKAKDTAKRRCSDNCEANVLHVQGLIGKEKINFGINYYTKVPFVRHIIIIIVILLFFCLAKGKQPKKSGSAKSVKKGKEKKKDLKGLLVIYLWLLTLFFVEQKSSITVVAVSNSHCDSTAPSSGQPVSLSSSSGPESPLPLAPSHFTSGSIDPSTCNHFERT